MELCKIDSFFAPGEHSVRTGFDHSLENPWVRYEEGYYLAALALIDRQLSEPDWAQEFVIYPILFLYRHHVELALKSILIEAMASFETCGEIKNKEDTRRAKHLQEITKEHNLLKLWDYLVTFITANRRKPMIDDTQLIRTILEELTTLDPTSMNTRYGLQRDMETPSLGIVRKLSLRNIREVFAKLSRDLNEIMIRFQYINEPWWDEELHEEWAKEQ